MKVLFLQLKGKSQKMDIYTYHPIHLMDCYFEMSHL
jgi:hypothetical protein